MTRFPDNPSIRLELARAQTALGDHAAAAETLRPLSSDDAAVPSPDALDLLARLELELGNFERAAKLTRRLSGIDGEALRAREREGDIAAAQGQHVEAAEIYRTVLANQPDPKVALKRFQALGRSGAVDEAIAFGEAWVDARPADLELRLNLANALLLREERQSAMGHYREVIERDPENLLALNNLAHLLGQEGDERALGLARRARTLAPDEASVADTLGWILVQNGDLNEGLTELRRAVRLAPENPDFRYRLAWALRKDGRLADAREQLDVALASGEAFSTHAEALELRASMD